MAVGAALGAVGSEPLLLGEAVGEAPLPPVGGRLPRPRPRPLDGEPRDELGLAEGWAWLDLKLLGRDGLARGGVGLGGGGVWGRDWDKLDFGRESLVGVLPCIVG